jgi:hypothetical protein
MVESMMFFALGCLVTSLLVLVLLPPVHARAERLCYQMAGSSGSS